MVDYISFPQLVKNLGMNMGNGFAADSLNKKFIKYNAKLDQKIKVTIIINK